MEYGAIIVGGGLAGLTAAAYLCKAGVKVLVCEKQPVVGGLVNSFEHRGFTFDGGIRAFENSGIVLPMLRQLGIPVEWVRNTVSIGVENDRVSLDSQGSLEDYRQLLNRIFPESIQDIQHITEDIRRVMDYMDILYGIDNPLFLDIKSDPSYAVKVLLPWLVKYLGTIRKIDRLDTPIKEYMQRHTSNAALIDVITQHFFQKTPAFFALSYFSLYLDYQYPKGGTGTLARAMEKFVLDHGGEIRTGTEICAFRPDARELEDRQGNVYQYKKLIWAADLKRLYSFIQPDRIPDMKRRKIAALQKETVSRSVGGDSIFSLYLAVDMDKDELAKMTTAHMFYTPKKTGLGNLLEDLHKTGSLVDGKLHYAMDKDEILGWLGKYLDLTTYEISIPVFRDDSLAPQGKAGMIVSTLMDYNLTRNILDAGWYEEFKECCATGMIDNLDAAIFKGIKEKVIDHSSSSPVTLERLTGNSDGAITGWAFTNKDMPAVHQMTRVKKSILTPLPDVYQAGQWSFSPSGLPISILTGKLAADRILQDFSAKR